MTELIKKDTWPQDLAIYTKRGLKCSLWNHDAKDMNREELLGFIGYLDALIELERQGIGPAFKIQSP